MSDESKDAALVVVSMMVNARMYVTQPGDGTFEVHFAEAPTLAHFTTWTGSKQIEDALVQSEGKRGVELHAFSAILERAGTFLAHLAGGTNAVAERLDTTPPEGQMPS